jgi:hypothetical protein
MTERPHPPQPQPTTRYVTRVEFDRRLSDLWSYVLGQTGQITRLGEGLMAQQEDIDALTAALAQEDSDLNTAVTGIQAEIAALQNANPALDLTALTAQVDATAAAVAAAAALVPPVAG